MRRLLRLTTVLTLSGLMVSSAATQQPTEKPKQLEVLGRYVGDWTSDVTSKPAVWTPEERRFRTFNHAEFVLDGWFLRHVEVSREIGTPNKVGKSLFLWTFDPKSKKYVEWLFQSSGVMGKWVGTWNQKEKSLTATSSDVPPMTTGRFSEAFPNDGAINGTLAFTGNDGTKLFDMVWTRKRQAGVGGQPIQEQWAKIGTPIRPIPDEVNRLKRLVGTWDSVYVFRVPQRPAVKGVISDGWALDGRFIMRRESVGHTNSIAMIGWDDNKRAYRIARAVSNGTTNEADGQWDDDARSLVWDWKVADSAVSATSTWRFVGNDAMQLHVVHEKGNDVLLDLTIKMRRRR